MNWSEREEGCLVASTYLTEQEAAAIARLSRITLWRYRRRRRVPHIVLPGGHPRYPRAEFLRWLRGLGERRGRRE